LREKLLCFQSSSIDCHGYKRNDEEIACRVYVEEASGMAVHALLLFSPHYLIPLDTSVPHQDGEHHHLYLRDDLIMGDPMYKTHINSDFGHPTTWYGARISARTQMVVMKEDISGVWCAATYAFGMKPDLQLPSELERCRRLWGYQSSEVRSSLLGYIDSVFGLGAASLSARAADPTVHKCGSLLLVGESGSGASSLIRFSTSYLHAKTVVLSGGTLFALTGGRAVTVQWVRQQLCAAITLSTSLGRCVLLLEDLHALAPRILNTDMQSVDVHEAIVEVQLEYMFMMTH